jgi:RHS repeat-associated protein
MLLFTAGVSLMLSTGRGLGQVLSTNVDSIVTATNNVPADPSSPPSPAPPPMVLTNPAPGAVPQFPSFSPQPTVQEIERARIFDEPLVPFGGSPSQNENAMVAQALLAFAGRTNTDDFSALTAYLRNAPSYHWYVPILYCLGQEYYNTGFYSQAIDAWEEAWAFLQDESNNGPAENLADRTIGELAKMYARIGNADALDEIFLEIGDRDLSGAASELIAGARQAEWLMRNRPEIAYRCGPLALRNICLQLNPSVDFNEIVLDSASTPGKGFSLAQLGQLAQTLQLNFQVARRLPGAALIVPCVVHWNVGHYAAILQKQGDRYFVADPTFGISRWVSQRALDAETSGYFLIPPGPLANNWETVSDEVAKTVWGRGITASSNPNDTAPYDLMADPNCDSHGMAIFNAHLLLVSLHIEDTPIAFTPPRGPPVRFTATYNQREANQPANFSFSNLGQKWTFNWLSYLTDNGTNTPGDVQYYVGGGGTETFNYQTNGTYGINWRNQASLYRLSSTNYMMVFADGSTNYFGQPDGSVGSTRRVFLTKVVDPTGYTNILNYDPTLRLVSLTDPQAGLTNLTFFYDANPIATDPLVIQKVTDRYGRSATFGYGTDLLQLQSIADVLSITSQVSYASSTFINALQTPYGTSTFDFGDDGAVRWLEMTDAQGGTSRVEYNQTIATGIPDSLPGNLVPSAGGGMYTRNYRMFSRNTFYWDKKAQQEAPGDYSKARVYHWLHDAALASAEGALESFKEPLESRIWFNYPGQAHSSAGATIYGTLNLPSIIGRVLDETSHEYQFYQTYRNSLGKITNSIDPRARALSSTYAANQIDLLNVRQTTGTNNELLASFTYNSQHLPLTATDASGQVTKFSWNAYGQITGITNALNEVTTFSYSTNGLLLTVVGPTNTAITSFGYDAFDRVNAVTNADGYYVRTSYDAFDRPVTNTFPDGSSETVTYQYLDPSTYTDRAGKVTQFLYDSLRHLTRTTEATNWNTYIGWCDCGGISSITDPLGRVTSWTHDIQGRITAKQYPDASGVRYTYEKNTSRIASFTNERGQSRTYIYYLDDTLNYIAYSDPSVTPTNILNYDSNYKRLTAMRDGSGLTLFDYYPVTSTPALGAGRLKTVSSFTGYDTITYLYDALGRIQVELLTNSLSTLLASNMHKATNTFDVLGRITAIGANALGSFNYTYVGASPRLASIAYPNSGQTANFAYNDIIGDLRLKALTNSAGALLSRFNYTYKLPGLITNWVKQLDSGTPITNSLAFDPIYELTSAVSQQGGSPQTNAFNYDLAGNRTLESSNANAWRAWFNPLNQIQGKDQGLSPTNRTYGWDEENRLVGVTNGSASAQITYDPFGRPAILTQQSGTNVYRHWFIWSLGRVIEEWNISNNIASFAWFYPDGCQTWSYSSHIAPVMMSRDHLGSIRELTDYNGNLLVRNDYDSFGRKSIVNSTTNAIWPINFDFASGYSIPGVGLNIVGYRVYDPDMGCWLSRDPIGESGGLNLYSYCRNDPVNRVDPLGLCAQPGFVGGRGQFRDPNTGQIRDSEGNPLKDQLNPLNPINFEGENSPAASSVERIAAETSATVDRIRNVAQQGYDYAVQNPRVQGLNRMQLGKDAEVQATRWLRRWAERNNVDLGPGGLQFQVRGANSVPDVVFDPARQIFDFKLTPRAVRPTQTRNFQTDFPGYNIEYIFGP